jgi:hypothetical protein
VAPADTVTLAGTVAVEELSLDNDTTAPPEGAGPFSVTVPVEGLPPTTLDGFKERDDSEGGLTVRVEILVITPYRAEIVTAVEPGTAFVVIGNVALVAPAATVTLAGTVAADVLSLPSDTIAPPPGAGFVSVTVPVEGLPPTTLDGLTCRVLNAGAGVTARRTALVTPP